jgi:metal-responsive CopG/Arc/MetJ family transcriptional regulator
MSKRVNITLPDATLAVLDRVTTKGTRSSFISRAVLRYVREQGKQSLGEQLKAGYQANADESLKIALEWFPLEEEAWRSESRATSRTKK